MSAAVDQQVNIDAGTFRDVEEEKHDPCSSQSNPQLTVEEMRSNYEKLQSAAGLSSRVETGHDNTAGNSYEEESEVDDSDDGNSSDDENSRENSDIEQSIEGKSGEQLSSTDSVLPDYGAPRMKFNRFIKGPVIVYDSKTHLGCIREFTRAKISQQTESVSAFGWKCFLCMKLVSSLPSTELSSHTNCIPTIIVSDGVIRSDPDNPGRIPHICHPRTLKDAEREYDDRCPPNTNRCGKKLPRFSKSVSLSKDYVSVSTINSLLVTLGNVSIAMALESVLRSLLEEKFGSVFEIVDDSNLKISTTPNTEVCVGDVRHVLLVHCNNLLPNASPNRAGIWLEERHLIIVDSLDRSPPKIYHEETEVGIPSLAALVKNVSERVQSWSLRYRVLELILSDLRSVEAKAADNSNFPNALVDTETGSITFTFDSIRVTVEIRREQDIRARGKRLAAWISAWETASDKEIFSRQVIETKRAWGILFHMLRPQILAKKKPPQDSTSNDSATTEAGTSSDIFDSRYGISHSSDLTRTERTREAEYFRSLSTSVESMIPASKLSYRGSQAKPAGVNNRLKQGGMKQRAELKYRLLSSQSRKVFCVPAESHDETTKHGENKELKTIEKEMRSILETRTVKKESYSLEMFQQPEGMVLSAVFYDQNLLRRYTVKIRDVSEKLSCKTEVSQRLSAVNSMWKLKSQTNWQDLPESDPCSVISPILDSVQEWLEEGSGSADSSNPEKSSRKRKDPPTTMVQSKSHSCVGGGATALITKEIPLNDLFESQPKWIKKEEVPNFEDLSCGVNAADLMR